MCAARDIPVAMSWQSAATHIEMLDEIVTCPNQRCWVINRVADDNVGNQKRALFTCLASHQASALSPKAYRLAINHTGPETQITMSNP